MKNFGNKEQKGIFKAKDLGCYIKTKYREHTHNLKEITPIKMQKALYFCFAFWAGFVMKGKADHQISETENQFLFDEHFEAWSYVPVVPDVYFEENKLLVKLFRSPEEEQQGVQRVEAIFRENSFLQETIDSILHDVFETSDFKLVSLSHMDKSWQNHFHGNDKKHNEVIPQEEIINEYSTKKFD